MSFDKVSRISEFDKDLKKLMRKFPTLKEDLELFIKHQLVLYHKQNVDNKGIYPLQGTRSTDPIIYKAKKFACRSLKGTGSQSGVRVIYSYSTELDRIDLIEIYYKGDKENEDRERIDSYCNEL